jgi:hypothetical protein
MHRLIVNPGTENAWEISLYSGANSLGRGEENNFLIEHSSISNTHCRVTVMNSGVIVKDQGSINGTFIDGKMIDESLLLPGQTLRLGDVIMRFESDLPARSISPNAIPLLPQLATLDDKTFIQLVGSAFAYPFKHDGLVLLIVGTFFYLVINFLGSHAMIAGFVLMLFGTGYLLNYMQRILTTSAMGENRMPDWPDFSDMEDIVNPFVQTLGTVLFSFGPLILLKIFAPADAAWKNWALIAAVIWGCVYFPMSFTAVAMFDSLGALNPLLIISSIAKIFTPYLLTIILLSAIVSAILFGIPLLENILPIPFLPSIISEFLSLYLLTVEMRILGRLYWTKKNELGWFNH